MGEGNAAARPHTHCTRPRRLHQQLCMTVGGRAEPRGTFWDCCKSMHGCQQPKSGPARQIQQRKGRGRLGLASNI